MVDSQKEHAPKGSTHGEEATKHLAVALPPEYGRIPFLFVPPDEQPKLPRETHGCGYEFEYTGRGKAQVRLEIDDSTDCQVTVYLINDRNETVGQISGGKGVNGNIQGQATKVRVKCSSANNQNCVFGITVTFASV